MLRVAGNAHQVNWSAQIWRLPGMKIHAWFIPMALRLCWHKLLSTVMVSMGQQSRVPSSVEVRQKWIVLYNNSVGSSQAPDMDRILMPPHSNCPARDRKTPAPEKWCIHSIMIMAFQLFFDDMSFIGESLWHVVVGFHPIWSWVGSDHTLESVWSKSKFLSCLHVVLMWEQPGRGVSTKMLSDID